MGLYCSLQLSRYPAISSEDSPTNHKRPTVCNQPYPTYGLNVSRQSKRFPRNSPKLITPKPAYSNNPRTATQKTIAQKMDARCKPLR
jgi:hypothetical protein